MIEAQKPGKCREVLHGMKVRAVALAFAVKASLSSKSLTTEGAMGNPENVKPQDQKTDESGRGWDCTVDSPPTSKPITADEKKFRDDALTAASITHETSGRYVSSFSPAGVNIRTWDNLGRRIGEGFQISLIEDSTGPNLRNMGIVFDPLTGKPLLRNPPCSEEK
ncbi:MAG: hypothetical protein AABW86_00020 [Candidatus Micrarchaeota archaeon]